jgi:putative membrane protein
MMKSRLLVAVLAMACMMGLLAGLSVAQDQTTGGNSNANRSGGSSSARKGGNNADTKFAMTAAQDGMTEVELGRLAVQKGMSDAVKQFGQRMIDDHGSANQQLMQLASSKGMTLPTTLDAKHAAMVAKFQRLSGAEFDRAYAKQMVQDHRKAVDLFQKEADRGADADLKAFASKTLPTLQGHLSMAQALTGGTTGNSNRGGSMSGGGNMNGNMNGNMGGGNTNSNRGGGNMNSNRNMNRGNANRGGGNANNSNR